MNEAVRLALDDAGYLAGYSVNNAKDNYAVEASRRLIRGGLAALSKLQECNEAMREPMRKLRESVDMWAQGEGSVVDRVLARWKAAEARLKKLEQHIIEEEVLTTEDTGFACNACGATCDDGERLRHNPECILAE